MPCIHRVDRKCTKENGPFQGEICQFRSENAMTCEVISRGNL